jgi:hypothetical protein
MGQSIKRHLMIIGIGVLGVMILTTFISLAFFGEQTGILLRNYAFGIVAFLVIYYIIVKVFGNYEAIYRKGLN